MITFLRAHATLKNIVKLQEEENKTATLTNSEFSDLKIIDKACSELKKEVSFNDK